MPGLHQRSVDGYETPQLTQEDGGSSKQVETDINIMNGYPRAAKLLTSFCAWLSGAALFSSVSFTSSTYAHSLARFDESTLNQIEFQYDRRSFTEGMNGCSLRFR